MSKLKLTGKTGIVMASIQGEDYDIVWSNDCEQTWKDFITRYEEQLCIERKIKLVLTGSTMHMIPIIDEIDTITGDLKLEVEDE